ncbi:MAG TPA: TMEM165/GDT1 family protein [Bacillota bacterium]|nr:TMEM165/GDT1 family protein [Bacillota bacterium]
MIPGVVLSTFLMVFLAEFGDKTQLATMLIAAKSGSPGSVLVGASLALLLTTALGVVMGTALARLVPAAYLRWSAGIGFIAVGILLLVRR